VKEERTRNCRNNLGRSVYRGEMPNELGDSWYSAKAIKVAREKRIVWKCKALGVSSEKKPKKVHDSENHRQT